MNTCSECGKPTYGFVWHTLCRCHFGHEAMFDEMVRHLAAVYNVQYIPLPNEDGKGESWVLPPQLQPGMDVQRLSAYKKAVKAGFYNDN